MGKNKQKFDYINFVDKIKKNKNFRAINSTVVLIVLIFSFLGTDLLSILSYFKQNQEEAEVTEFLQESESLNIEKEIAEIDILSNPDVIENELDNDIDFIPENMTEITSEVFILVNNMKITNFSSFEEYISAIHINITSDISTTAHLIIPITDNELLSNKDYLKYAEEANIIDKQIADHINENSANKDELNELYEEVITSRETALTYVNDAPQMALQLARNYMEYTDFLIKNYNMNDYYKNLIYKNASKGIEMFNYVLEYNYRVDEYGDIIYRIAQLYHFIGNIEELDDDMRWAYFIISASYYEYSIQQNTIEYKYFNEYYAGMTHHKLGVISYDENYIFLNTAALYYNNIIKNPNCTKQMVNYANSYLQNVEERLKSINE